MFSSGLYWPKTGANSGFKSLILFQNPSRLTSAVQSVLFSVIAIDWHKNQYTLKNCKYVMCVVHTVTRSKTTVRWHRCSKPHNFGVYCRKEFWVMSTNLFNMWGIAADTKGQARMRSWAALSTKFGLVFTFNDAVTDRQCLHSFE